MYKRQDDIFSNQMKVCRPQFVKLLCAVSVCVISDSCNIVCKSIKPYIYNMLWIEIYRNSPLEGCSCLLYTSPLTKLCELLSHKEKLLSRMSHHKCICHLQVAELIPSFSRHLIQHGAFQMNNLIMRKYKNIVCLLYTSRCV